LVVWAAPAAGKTHSKKAACPTCRKGFWGRRGRPEPQKSTNSGRPQKPMHYKPKRSAKANTRNGHGVAWDGQSCHDSVSSAFASLGFLVRYIVFEPTGNRRCWGSGQPRRPPKPLPTRGARSLSGMGFSGRRGRQDPQNRRFPKTMSKKPGLN